VLDDDHHDRIDVNLGLTVIVDSSVESRLDRNLRKRVSSFREDDDDDDYAFNDDGKSESPSYIDYNNDDCGEVDNDNDGNDECVYNENDESNPEYDEYAFININTTESSGVCHSSRVDNDIIEQGAEELLDSNAETIDYINPLLK
jgi:hypothetical protein